MDPIRVKCRDFLSTSLAHSTSCAPSVATALATALEYNIYNVHATASNPYRAHIRNLGLTFSSYNKELAERLVDGEVTVQEVAGASSQDLASTELQEEIATIKETSLHQSTGIDTITARGQPKVLLPPDGSDEPRGPQVGAAEDVDGSEGEFKERMQPGGDGLEFETS